MTDWREDFKRAAIDFIVLNGGIGNVDTRYGTESLNVYSPWERTPPETLQHMVDCGVDYANCGNIKGCEWSEFLDTYSDNTDHSGLWARAVCNCGEVGEYFVFEGTFNDILLGILGVEGA